VEIFFTENVPMKWLNLFIFFVFIHIMAHMKIRIINLLYIYIRYIMTLNDEYIQQKYIQQNYKVTSNKSGYS
jgi:hypothetical protein